MISLQITDIKNFMNQLLGTTTFDSFLLAEATITTYNTFIIDGHIIPEFFISEDSLEEADSTTAIPEFSRWSDMRSLCYHLIKGKRTPVGFRVILHLSNEQTKTILAKHPDLCLTELKALVLNIKYDGHVLTCITATAVHTFTPDKTIDKLWDNTFKQFLTAHKIVFEEL
ncbi:MAG: DUF5721 family protein [Lachnospiraceae bacterium]